MKSLSERGISYDDAIDFDINESRNGTPYYIEARNKCLRYDFCNNLGITTEICEEHGNKVLRCTQGDFALIQLTSRQSYKKK